ncbi:hypothetical protein AB0383_20385 [Amycolatopsis sp. NPDC051373]|uniref:hypothetical protein n=1 Tax=Amycolatopsis sp. NPDC051373 TaxID=3155801 RepID=UPI00344BC202
MKTAQELLDAYAHDYTDPDGECAHDCDDYLGLLAPKAFAALRAVLDEHTPEDEGPQYAAGTRLVCTGCLNAAGEYREYPCATVKAIAAALDDNQAGKQ